MMRSRILASLLVALLILTSHPTSLSAQTRTETGSIAGSVVDPDGRAILAATIVVRNNTTGQTQALSTDSAGRFTVPALAIGSYTVEATAPGMALGRREDVKFTAGQKEELAFKLSVGTVQENVTIRASVASESAPSQAMLSARSAQSVVSEEFIRNNTSPAADYSQVMLAVPGM